MNHWYICMINSNSVSSVLIGLNKWIKVWESLLFQNISEATLSLDYDYLLGIRLSLFLRYFYPVLESILFLDLVELSNPFDQLSSDLDILLRQLLRLAMIQTQTPFRPLIRVFQNQTLDQGFSGCSVRDLVVLVPIAAVCVSLALIMTKCFVIWPFWNVAKWVARD